MAMIYLGSVEEESAAARTGAETGGECQCIAPPCPCDMKVVSSPSQCPVGTKAEIIPSGDTPEGTSAITVTRYRCVPTSFIGRLGIEPRWLIIGAIAVGALLVFSGGSDGRN